MATAFAIVGRRLIDFPEDQVERIAYAYIGGSDFTPVRAFDDGS
jgi:hypothetical protein